MQILLAITIEWPMLVFKLNFCFYVRNETEIKTLNMIFIPSLPSKWKKIGSAETFL